MTVGLLCGKFYPPHAGHKYLMDYAVSHSDTVYGFVVYEDDEVPNVEQRLSWVQEIAPQITWTSVKNTPGKEDDSAHWALEARKALQEMKYPDNRIDYVFTSEDYGDTWATELGCKHIKVDLARDTFHISGTRCRTNPWTEWRYLTPPARQYYAKRVCLVGGESTGKTTMARLLAEEFETLWVPEVGRSYVEEWGTEDPDIWKAILATQQEFENHLARQCNGLLISDTDLLTTAVWYENWVGELDDVMNRLLSKTCYQSYARYNILPYDLYILLDHTVPWVQDGSRSEEDKRDWYTNRLRERIENTAVPYIIIDADNYEERFVQAAEAITKVVDR